MVLGVGGSGRPKTEPARDRLTGLALLAIVVATRFGDSGVEPERDETTGVPLGVETIPSLNTSK
jgi:hypothetical protein